MNHSEEQRREAELTLSVEQRQRVQELARRISPAQPHSLVQYGADIQEKMARLADSMLNQMRSHQTEEQIGSILHTLLDKLREIEPDDILAPPRGILARIFRASAAKTKQKMLARCQKTNYEMERMADTLERLRHQMLRDTTMLDVLYERNREYFHELSLYLAAAREKLKEVRETVLPAMRKRVEESEDPIQMQELMDMERFADRLEKKAQDLLISQTIAFQTAPQIRMIQENHEMLMEKIRSSILTTIPLWKSQMVILLSLLRQQGALSLQHEITRESDAALREGARALKEAARSTAREQGRAVAEVEAFKDTQEELVTVIEQTLHIQQESSKKRRQVEQALVHIEQDAGTKLDQARSIG
ncbi:toxic anion resistance protein [Aneurinibacillus sp. BA2021]|nr:toxic anion resistance protein [Aneurinibacillus sp. BA2021]